MGRKANAKKIIRELRQSKKDKDSKKHKKNKKQKHSKNSRKHNKQKVNNTKSKFSSTQIIGLILAFTSLLMILIFIFLLFQKGFKPNPIAKYLPADRTIALAEMNVNLEHNLNNKLFSQLADHPEYSKENLITFVETYFNTDYESNLKPWLGRQVGIAILKNENEPKQYEQIYFIETLNQEKALEYFGKPQASYHNQDISIYSLPSGLHFSFIKNYLIIGNTEENLLNLIQEHQSKDSLYRSQNYRRIDDNLPLNRLGFAYIDYSQVTPNIIQSLPFINQTGFSQIQNTPLFTLLNSHGFVLIPQDQNIIFQSFLSLNVDMLQDQKYITHTKKYRSELTAYAPEKTLLFWGSTSLEHQLNKILEVVSLSDQTQIDLFYKSLDTYTQTYFGSNIDLNKDILPLFEKEYAFLLERHQDQNIFKILLKLDNPADQSQQIEQIANDFAKLGSVYDQQTVEYILEDGTWTQEIISIPKKIVKSQSDYENIIINELQLGNRDWGVYYSIHNDIAILASQIEGIHSTIDIINDQTNSIKESPIYYSDIEPLFQHSDELTFINLEQAIPLLFEQENLPPFLDVFGTLSTGKNYFNDGIVTINYLSIK